MFTKLRQVWLAVLLGVSLALSACVAVPGGYSDAGYGDVQLSVGAIIPVLDGDALVDEYVEVTGYGWVRPVYYGGYPYYVDRFGLIVYSGRDWGLYRSRYPHHWRTFEGRYGHHVSRWQTHRQSFGGGHVPPRAHYGGAPQQYRQGNPGMMQGGGQGYRQPQQRMQPSGGQGYRQPQQRMQPSGGQDYRQPQQRMQPGGGQDYRQPQQRQAPQGGGRQQDDSQRRHNN